MNDFLDLHALVDGELEGDAKKAAEERLSTCDRSRAEYEAVRQLKATIADKCEPITCEKTWADCKDRIQALNRTRKVERFVSKYAWGLCGAFLVCIAVGGSLNRVHGSVRTGDVARVSASLSPFSIQSGPEEEGNRDLFKGIMEPMVIRPESVKVVGGASGMIDGHKVVRLNLTDDTGPLALFLFADTEKLEDAQNLDGQGFAICNVNGWKGITWFDKPHSYLLIADRPFDELQLVAQAIRKKVGTTQ